MDEIQLSLVKAALAALSQNATYDADIIYAKRCLRELNADPKTAAPSGPGSAVGTKSKIPPVGTG